MSNVVKSELSDRERRYLQRAVSQPGYKVLEKIIGGFVQTIEDHATDISRNDPLRNSETIIRAWAYAAVAKQFQQDLAGAVKFELDFLNRTETAPPTPEEIAQRRRAIALGELDVAPEGKNEDGMAE